MIINSNRVLLIHNIWSFGENMKIVFQLVGKCDDSNPSSIPINTIRQWEQEGWVTYLGEIQDIRPIIAKSSCIILPSYREGIPKILLEAMSMHKPIITTNVSGCKECVKNPRNLNGLLIGENGIMAEAKNPYSLSQAIEYFLSLTPREQKQMGKSGREYVLERFDISKTIEFYKQKVGQYHKGKKSLAFISNTSFGMSVFRLEVLQALCQDGYEIHIIAPQDISSQRLIDNGFFFYPIAINSKGLNPMEDFSTLYAIYKLLRYINPSLVFNYTIKPIVYGSIVCNLLKIPNIAITTGLGYVFIQGGIKKQILKKFVCFLCKSALTKTQEVWFLNKDDRETFLFHRIIPQGKAILLDSEGVNTSYFAPQENKSQEFIFTFIARMLWDKGVGEFIEAIKLGAHL